jgi:hypothetical protein
LIIKIWKTLNEKKKRSKIFPSRLYLTFHGWNSPNFLR